MSAANLRDAYNSTGAGIDCRNGADWQINGNHIYRCPNNALVVNHAFISFVCHNKIDNFGLSGAASTNYRGIWITNSNGPATTLVGNEVDGTEIYGQSTTNYYYYESNNSPGLPATITMASNIARKQSNNPNNGKSVVLNLAGTGTGGSMTANDWGTTAQANSGQTPPSMAPNLSGTVSLLRGPLPAAVAFSPAQPAGTTSTTMVMAGIGSACTYTPVLTGKVLVRITGIAGTATAVASVNLQGYYGTGTAPGNGRTLTGTAFGPGAVSVRAQTTTATGLASFVLEGQISGLTFGAKHWIDFAFLTGSSSAQANVSNLYIVVQEIN
jgi:hypothetical protein